MISSSGRPLRTGEADSPPKPMAEHPTTPRQRPEELAKPFQEACENLRGLESRLDGLASEGRQLAAEDPFDPRIRKLKGMVEDLANDVRDQRAHATAALDALESLAAGRTPPRAALDPVPAYPMRYLRFPRRVAGFLLRKARAVARRLLPAESGSPRDSPRVELRTEPREEARRPSLTLLLQGSRDPSSGASLSIPTAASVELMYWQRDEGGYQVFDAEGQPNRSGRARTADEIRDAARGDFCARLDLSPDELPPGALELAALVLTVEPLAFFHLCFHQDPANGGVLLAHRDVWHPLEHLDLDVCKRWQRSPVLGKTAFLERHGLPVPLPLEATAARQLRGVEHYFVNPAARGTLVHTLRDLDKVLPATAQRPAVGVLLDVQLRGGVDRLLGDLGRSLGERNDLLLFVLEATDSWTEDRLQEHSRSGFRVYPMTSALPKASIGPAVSFLLSRHAERRLLYVGDPRRLPEKIPDVAARFSGEAWFEVLVQPEPLLGGEPRGKSSGVAGAVRIAKPPWSVPEAILRTTVSGAGQAALRAEWALPAEAVLVTMVSDLVITARPEDFVALAARFCDEPGFAFLLVGDGPHAGAVEDMRRYLDPPHFRHLRRVDDVGAVLAASDLFCTTSELEPLPSHWLDALALGRPVIAAAVDGLGDLLAAGPCGRAVPRVGDLPELERAVRELGDPATRQRYGENARRLVEQDLSLRPAHEVWTELLFKRSMPGAAC